MEFEIHFTDVTLLETNGVYQKVCALMDKDVEKTQVKNHKELWMLRSNVTVMSPFGFCLFVCHFYNDGKVYIAEFMPSTKDIHVTDVRCLTYWCNHNGWSTPEPLPAVVQSWLPFWKKEWETHIVDSEYLDNRFGSRKEIQFDRSEDDGVEAEDEV